MGVNQNQNRKIAQRPGGFFEDFANRFRLIGRLMLDNRVNPLLKILPVGTLIYVLSPVDFLPLNPVDDAFLIWAGTTLFVELCPPQIVEEHMQLLQRVIPGQWKDFSTTNPVSQDDVVEGEYTETEASDKGRSKP
ncbi:MAG: DUF1232 domain-containing protein [Anaerolineaceae bacterium]|nr:DUF1232 domain-containing protein [Anaerolineaceae bacterium]